MKSDDYQYQDDEDYGWEDLHAPPSFSEFPHVDTLPGTTDMCESCKLPLDNHGLAHWPNIICPEDFSKVIWGAGLPPEHYYRPDLSWIDDPFFD